MVKVITFFNEKGGTGKTTLTALFASWLAYEKHEKVYVFDMDFPMYQMFNLRENDKRIWNSDPKSPFGRACAENKEYFYPVGKAASKESFSDGELENIAKSLELSKKKAGDGYFLLDFPGRYLPNDPVHYLSRKGLINLVVFPIDTDAQSRGSAMRTYVEMQRVYEKKGGRQEAAFLWNRETQKERSGKKDWYEEPNRIFAHMGIPVIGTRLRDILIARRDATTFGFIRNTLCWPKQNIAKACGYIDNIFEEVKARVDGTWQDDRNEEKQEE